MATSVTNTSHKKKQTVLILCCLGFIGFGGIHDFYVGNIGKGIIKLITLNWFVIGTIIDLVKIAGGTYTDGSGTAIRE